MRASRIFRFCVLLATPFLSTTAAFAQGTAADYERANGLRAKYEGLVVNVPGAATWIDRTHRFWYRRTTKGGSEFVVYDADLQQKRPAFDHEKLAAALSKATGQAYTAQQLPFNTLTFTDNERAIDVTFDGTTWTCALADYSCREDDAPRGRGQGQGRLADDTRPRPSPDKKWEALINNYNVAIRPAGSQTLTWLSLDGSEGNPYELASIAWSPDSKTIAAYRVKPGYRREVHYVESSPKDQLQPKYSSLRYAKPGDVLDLQQPVLFDVASKRELAIDNGLFPNPYSLTRLEWRKDSRAVTFEYNQRGHQVYRVIEIHAATGRARAIVSEEPKTFFNYRTANGSQTDSGKKFRYDVADGKEIVWMSERDGWNHLYLIDGATGAVTNQITKGAWAVRGVVKVDEEKRQIWFSASGMYPGKDPYFLNYYRINFDGSGLTRLTNDDANHGASVSSDQKYSVDTYSRIDTAPVSELRRVDDGTLVTEIEHGDIGGLIAAGWRAPEVFVSKARDGKTDIWGIIVRPTNFDPSKKYPVIENIYAGPQGSFVPKSFSRSTRCRPRPNSGSSSCRSTAWARRIGRRRSTTSRGRTSATPASRIASSGTRPWPRSIRGTTSRASASTARPPADRTRSARSSSTRSSTRWRCPRPAATTTAWTRSGGTSSGWDGRSVRSTRRPRTSTTRTASRVTCCLSSAKWTTTSIPRRRCRWSTS